jgi:hypothetical protein
MDNQLSHYHLGCGERLQTRYPAPALKKIRETNEINRLKVQKHTLKDKRRV